MSGHLLAGRYRLGERLGGGGMGTVWSAVDETLRRTVAVKEIVFPDVLTEEERRVATDRARREARAAALIGHPGVVTVHDVVVEDERPWIVMELVRGASLEEAVRRDGPRTPAEAARIGLEVLDALAAAHAKGIVHRDVKPGNVLLAEDGRVVLTDFGIASIDADPALTRTGTFLGSPGYIAPERLRDLPAGPESDLWSLGATLYKAVEGRSPFKRDDSMAVLGAVLSEDPKPPQRAGSLAPLLWQLLQKEPSARPKAGDVRRVLQNVAAGRPSGLSAWTPSPPPSPPRRGRVAALVAAGVAVVAATAVVAVVVAVNAVDGEATAAPDGTAQVRTSTPAAPSATPSPSGPAPVDLCGLLTQRQVTEVLGEGEVLVEDEENACGWAVPKRGLTVRDLGRTSGGPPPQSPAEAHTEFVSSKNTTRPGTHLWGWPEIEVDRVKARQSGPSAVGGIGDEAFTYSSRGMSKPMDISGVVLRVKHMVLEVEHMYERGSASGEDARRVARWVARAASS